MQPCYSYYKLLGVHAQSTDAEIKAAYYSACRAAHPDKGGDADTFATLAQAYHAIKNADARRKVLQYMELTGRACGDCDGSGAQRRQRGFTAVDLLACDTCGGCGHLLRG